MTRIIEEKQTFFFDWFDPRSCPFFVCRIFSFVLVRHFFLTSNRSTHDTVVASPDNHIVLCAGHWSVAAGNETSLHSKTPSHWPRHDRRGAASNQWWSSANRRQYVSERPFGLAVTRYA
jgi:hypothetical protein